MTHSNVYFAVNSNGDEVFSNYKLIRNDNTGTCDTNAYSDVVVLQKGTIKKLTGYNLAWKDDAKCISF